MKISLLASLLLGAVLSSGAFVAPSPSLRPLTTVVNAKNALPGTIISNPGSSTTNGRTLTHLDAMAAWNWNDNWNELIHGKWKINSPKPKAVMVQPSQRLSTVFILLGAALGRVPIARWVLGVPSGLFGLLLFKQTRRVRIIFDENNRLCLKTKDKDEWEYNKDVGTNKVTGTPSNWDVDAIVNYDFFPKWGPFNPRGGIIGPIICYFKERETPKALWKGGILGSECNDPEKIKKREAIMGQPHFLPCLFNSAQMLHEFEKRGCRKLAKPRYDYN